MLYWSKCIYHIVVLTEIYCRFAIIDYTTYSFLSLKYVYIFLADPVYTRTWVCASWIKFNSFPTRCNLFSLLHFCRQLYVFRALTPIIRSSYNCKYSLWYWLTGSTTIRSRCWVGTDSCVSYGTYCMIHMNQFQLNNESGW